MTEEGKQAAADGPDRSKTPGAGTDLDSLLNEWNQSSTAEPNTRDVVQAIRKEVKPVIDFARTEASRKANEEIEKDLNSAVAFMKEPEEYKDFPEFWVKGYLEAYSAENPSFTEAFEERGKNPEQWSAALSKARDSFAERAGQLPGSKVRSDVEAAKAAVTGTSPERSEEPEKSEQEQAAELFEMSEADYRRHVQKETAKASAQGR